MDYFDYEKVAEEAGISGQDLDRIRQVVRLDYPNDPMLFELHVLRVCTSIREGRATVESVLAGTVSGQLTTP